MTGPEDAPETFADDARRYRLDSRIATGGMGEVWRTTDTVLGREVAVKLLKSEYADDPAFRSRFETEARHAGALQHPGIAAVFDFGEATATDGSGHVRPYLVMELVDGQPLSALLRPGEAMDPEVARDLIAQAADAIGAAHVAGIVHRDLKPANLLVTPARQVKITDFGIARAADGLALTQTGQVMGTPQYLSPEQARGQGTTPASDVYSLGVVAFECLAGRRPFSADSPVATALAHLREPVPPLPDDVPADLAAVVRTAMAKEPQQRYADGAAFAAALRDPATAATAVVAAPVGDTGEHTQVLAGAAAGAAAGGAAAGAGAAPAAAATPPTGGGTGRTGPSGGRRRGTWWLLGGALALLVVLVVGFLVLGNEGDSTDPTDQPTGRTGKPGGDRSSAPSAPTTAPTTGSTTQSTEPTQPTKEPSSQTTEPTQESSPTGETSTEPTTPETSAGTPTDTATDATTDSTPTTQTSAPDATAPDDDQTATNDGLTTQKSSTATGSSAPRKAPR